MLDCVEYHSEYHALEIKRHDRLTDKFCLHFFELPKIPKTVTKDNGLELWLTLFNANTEEELKQIEEMGVSIMTQAIKAYRHVTTTDEFKELERLRSRARSNEASALGNAERRGIAIGAENEREKWQGVIAEKDAENEKLRKQLNELQAKLNG